MTFANLGLSLPILQAITEQGYKQPSPIQAEAIPAVLAGQDVMAAAQTGTGKQPVLRCRYWSCSVVASGQGPTRFGHWS